jgi:DNA-directed RNA polymerase specialized sigma24 family protein
MLRTPPNNPVATRLGELHQANLAGEPTATAEIFSLTFRPLSRHLKITRPDAPDDQVNDATTDAILAYLRKPGAFDPQKGSLWTFLCVIAARRLSDLRRSAGRERLPVNLIPIFELQPLRPNNLKGEDHLLAHEIEARYLTEIARDEKELQVLELMCSDVRGTSQYAVALGLDSADPGTAHEVKRVKDKLKARLKKVRNAINAKII